MGVRAENGTRQPVDVPGEGLLLRSRFAVEIHQDDGRLLPDSFYRSQTHSKRAVGGRHEYAPLKVHDRDSHSTVRVAQKNAGSGSRRRINFAAAAIGVGRPGTG